MSTMNAMDRKAYFLWKKDQNIPERVIAEAQKDAAEEAQLRLEAEEKVAEAEERATQEAHLRLEAQKKATEAKERATQEAQLRLEAQKKAAEAEERIAQLLRQVEAQRDGSKEV